MKNKTTRQMILTAAVASAFLGQSVQHLGITAAHAQVTPRGGVAVGGVGNQVQIAPGTYEQIRIEAQPFISVFREMNAEDSQWMKDMLAEINRSIETMKEKHIALALEASESLTLMEGMDLKKFLALTTPVNAELHAIRSKIDALTSVPSARNMNNVAKLESGKMTVQTAGGGKSIDLTQFRLVVEKSYDSTIQGLNTLKFKVHAKNPPADAPGPYVWQVLGKELNEALLKDFTAKEINKLTVDAQNIESNAKSGLLMEQVKIRDAAVKIAQTIIDEWGIKDRWQIRKLDEGGMKKAMDRLDKIYLGFSVLRYYYAVPIGAFGTPDTRRPFSFQQVPVLNDNQIKITNEPITDADKLEAARKYIFDALQTQNDWAGNNNGKGLLERLSNPLSNLSNLITFLSFKETWSKLNAFVLQRMLREIEEELSMTEAGGIADLKALLRQRAKENPEIPGEVEKIVKVIDTASGGVDANTAVGAGGAIQIVSKMATAIERYERLMSSANALRRQAKTLSEPSSVFKDAKKTRMNDLFTK